MQLQQLIWSILIMLQNWVVFQLLVLQIGPLENAIFLLWIMQIKLTILNIIFFGMTWCVD
jgi:hypothetical protein